MIRQCRTPAAHRQKISGQAGSGREDEIALGNGLQASLAPTMSHVADAPSVEITAHSHEAIKTAFQHKRDRQSACEQGAMMGAFQPDHGLIVILEENGQSFVGPIEFSDVNFPYL